MNITKFVRSLIVFTIGIIAILMGTALMSCQKPEEKVQNAKENVADAKQELTEAQQNASAAFYKEWTPFKAESEEMIKKNTTILDAFKVTLSNSSKVFRDRYETRVSELENRNNNLKDKLADYKDEGTERWKTFQQEVTHDMNELAAAIKELPTTRG